MNNTVMMMGTGIGRVMGTRKNWKGTIGMPPKQKRQVDNILESKFSEETKDSMIREIIGGDGYGGFRCTCELALPIGQKHGILHFKQVAQDDDTIEFHCDNCMNSYDK